MTNTSSNASSKTSIHILLQGKGGVGKSLISNVAGVDANLCLLWSPWRPSLCPVFGVCSAPAVRGDFAPEPQSKPRREKRATRLAPTSDPVERSAKPSLQAEFQQ